VGLGISTALVAALVALRAQVLSTRRTICLAMRTLAAASRSLRFAAVARRKLGGMVKSRREGVVRVNKLWRHMSRGAVDIGVVAKFFASRSPLNDVSENDRSFAHLHLNGVALIILVAASIAIAKVEKFILLFVASLLALETLRGTLAVNALLAGFLLFGEQFGKLIAALQAVRRLAAVLVMSFGLAGIGLSVMHDANHGAYSKKKEETRVKP